MQFVSSLLKACVKSEVGFVDQFRRAQQFPGRADRRMGQPSGRMVTCALIGLIVAVLFASIDVRASDAWEERFFNPQAYDDDVILPMPCKGSMVFRRVQVPITEPLGDYAITVGQDNDEWGYLEQTRPAHIAGSFTVDAPDAGRYYLMAKYELTELQYQALAQESCPQPSNRLRLPQVRISWFDAVSAANRYTLWLHANAKGQMPSEDGVLGYVRLPTEEEWEFAARGGMAVSNAEFRDTRFPAPEGLGRYAWFSGTQSANGKIQLTGLLQGNPLGLHDVLGNAQEMMFESFRLNKLDRLHGQAGGYIVRGGSYLTPQSELRTALRQEQSYYGTESASMASQPMTGVRLALVAPILTSRERISRVEAQWKSLGSSSGAQLTPESVPQPDPQGEIAEIASRVEDAELRDQLERLRRELRANTLARDEQRDQAIRSELQLGAFLCTKLNDDGRFLDTLERNFQRDCASVGSETANDRCRVRLQQLDGHREVFNFILNYYADTVVGSALNYDRSLMEAQVPVVAQQMASRQKSNLRNYLDSHWGSLRQYMVSGRVSRNQWLESCKAVTN